MYDTIVEGRWTERRPTKTRDSRVKEAFDREGMNWKRSVLLELGSVNRISTLVSGKWGSD